MEMHVVCVLLDGAHGAGRGAGIVEQRRTKRITGYGRSFSVSCKHAMDGWIDRWTHGWRKK